jgi:DNA-binding beta-propeller fold protein YncE
MDTLGGKGNFIADGQYLCCGWQRSRLYLVDLGRLPETPRWDVFLEDPRLRMSDDLVVSRDRTRAYCACYGGAGESWVAVVSIPERRVVTTIATGAGTCGLTMSADERFVIASADAEDAISVIDTETDAVCATVSARRGFREAGIGGYIQGISSGGNGDVYVYGCSGNGALAVFHGLGSDAEVTISWPGGRWHGKGGAA